MRKIKLLLVLMTVFFVIPSAFAISRIKPTTSRTQQMHSGDDTCAENCERLVRECWNNCTAEFQSKINDCVARGLGSRWDCFDRLVHGAAGNKAKDCHDDCLNGGRQCISSCQE